MMKNSSWRFVGLVGEASSPKTLGDTMAWSDSDIAVEGIF